MTTRESKIIEITKAIQAAVPDVVDNQFMYNCTLVADICKNCCEYSSECTCKEGENISIREIMLYLDQQPKIYLSVCSKGFIFDLYTNKCIGIKYNLHKDRIEDQDNELIDFLFTFTQS